jgi:hypothetical protein
MMTLDQAIKLAAERGGAHVYFSRMFTDWRLCTEKRLINDADTDSPVFTVLADGRVLAPGKLERRVQEEVKGPMMGGNKQWGE